MPRRRQEGLPAQPTFSAVGRFGKPDLRQDCPRRFKVFRPRGATFIRNFAIALDLKEDKWVKAIEDFRPTHPRSCITPSSSSTPAGTAAKKELASGQVGLPGGMSALGGLGGLGGKAKPRR